MMTQPVHNTGERNFRPGEAIYINRAVEQVEPHLHTHDFIEIAYVADGEGTHHLGREVYPVSKGHVFVINYNVAHEFRSLPDESKPPLLVYNCIFKPEFLDYTLINCKDFHHITQHFLFRSLFPHETAAENDFQLLGSECGELEELYLKMYEEYQRRGAGYIELLRAYVIVLLVTLFRRYHAENAADGKNVDVRRRKMIENAMSYMKQNYNREIRLDDLSMMSFFSPNYFCRLFKETTGTTVSAYIQKIRIQEACRLLSETDDTVLDIAQQVGYKDIKFFNQVFRRNTGQSPGSYRENGHR